MEESSFSVNPRTLDDVFKDFLGRRSGILKALTSDVEEFCDQCDPEKENLCLYGFPDEAWEVSLPAEEVPPEIPEPALGINFARDGMQRKDWISLVAVHSDAWLVSVAFYFGARFDKHDRKRLFNLINDVPTVLDVVTGKKSLRESLSSAKVKDVTTVISHKSNGKANSSTIKKSTKTPTPAPKTPMPAPPVDRGDNDEDEAPDENDADAEEDEKDTYEGDEDEHESTLCGICSECYGPDEFWIGCDICERWFHGKCVKITPARAEHIKQYKCPFCSNKRVRA